MAAVFTLFGELKADTGAFKNSLRDAEARLKATERAIEQTEAKAKRIGQTSATTARSFEKMNERVAETRAKLQQTAAAFERGETTSKKMGSAFQSADKAANNLTSRLKDQNARLADMANRAQNATGSVSKLGQVLTTALAAGLTAVAYAAIRSTIELDNVRNKLVAATGSTEAASKKWAELNKLAAKSPGVFASAAAELYAMFRQMDLGEQTITNLIKGIGKLRLVTPEINAAGFAQNLAQLFGQKFELTDVKELFGKTPIALKILQDAFKLSSSDVATVAAEMKKKLAEGLSKEDFFATFSEAINNNKTLAGLGETFGSRMQKAVDRIAVAFQPLGDKILTAAVPGLESAADSMSRIFTQATSKSMIEQFFVEAAGAIISGGLLIAETAANVAATVTELLPEAWGGGKFAEARNRQALENINKSFNDLRQAYEEKSIQFAETVKEADEKYLRKVMDDPNASAALRESAFKRWQSLQQGFDAGSVVFKNTVEKDGDLIGKSLGVFSDKVNLPDNFGAKLTKNMSSIPDSVNQQVGPTANAATNLGNVFGLNLNESILNWQAPVQNTAKQTINFQHIEVEGARQGRDIGWNIGTGLINGLLATLGGIMRAGKQIADAATNAISAAVEERSPSKVTMRTGRNIGEGLIIGMNEKVVPVANKAKELASKVTDAFKDLTKDVKESGKEVAAMLANFARFAELQTALDTTNAMKQTILDLIKLRAKLGITGGAPTDAVSELASLKQLESTLDNIFALVPKTTDFNAMMSAFSDPKATKEIEARAKALGMTADQLKRIVEETQLLANAPQGNPMSATGFAIPGGRSNGAVVPGVDTQTHDDNLLQPPTQAWSDFWGTMFESLSRMRNELPSMKSLIGENLIDSISQIGDVFANAVTRWDGTAKGFFKSIATGFAAMAREIIAQLIRIAVMQAVLKLVGLISGVAAGGASSAAGAPGGSIGTSTAGPIGGAFSGGSSLLGGIADAGKNLASGFTGALSGFGGASMMPAFAGSAGTTFNNSRTTNATFNISGGGSTLDARASMQVAKEALRLLDKEQRRNK